MTLLAAFQSLLSWYSKDEDIVVGSPSAGRSQAATEPLIGYFVNTLVLRTDLSGDPEFRGVLQRVREVTLGALANQDVPFERLVDDLRPERTLSYNPLFQVWFVLQPAQQEKLDFEGLTVETLAIDSQSTRHDLQLSLWETSSGINGAFIYRTDLFNERTISHMIDEFENLLATVAERPKIRLSELHSVLDEADRKYRKREAEKLEQTGYDKLRTVRRKAVTEIN
jgi:non-ribosomal peptide synthetase component F